MKYKLLKIIDIFLVLCAIIFIIVISIKKRHFSDYFLFTLVCAFVNLVAVFSKDDESDNFK